MRARIRRPVWPGDRPTHQPQEQPTVKEDDTMTTNKGTTTIGKPPPTLARLRELLDFEPGIGLIWRVSRDDHVRAHELPPPVASQRERAARERIRRTDRSMRPIIQPTSQPSANIDVIFLRDAATATRRGCPDRHCGKPPAP